MIKKHLDQFLEKALVNYDLPGLAAGISFGHGSMSRHADLRYYGAQGFRDWEAKKPLEPRNIFHMASVTKLFVGTSVIQLSERNRVDIEGYLTDYLSWFTMADERYRRIKIRHLLSHTSGMPDVSDYHWDKPETDEGALERYIRSEEVTGAHLLWSPEENKFSYSNIGYEILGAVIASVSGMAFEDYVRKNIFEPLGMEDSTLLSFERGIYEAGSLKSDNLCTPHEKDEQKHIVKTAYFPYNRAHGPSSTLTSNIFDIEKWGMAHLNHTLLKQETYQTVWKEETLVPNNGEKICLSWFKREQNGFALYGHEGTDDGFRASFWICPELKMSIVVCSNLSNAPVKKISKQLFDMLT